LSRNVSLVRLDVTLTAEKRRKTNSARRQPPARWPGSGNKWRPIKFSPPPPTTKMIRSQAYPSLHLQPDRRPGKENAVFIWMEVGMDGLSLSQAASNNKENLRGQSISSSIPIFRNQKLGNGIRSEEVRERSCPGISISPIS